MSIIFNLDYAINKCSYKVAHNTMLAIVKTESKGNPLAININGNIRLKNQPKTFKQALLWVNYLEKNKYNIDIGLAQVNIKNVHKFGFKARDMLEPCRNLFIASWILRSNYINALDSSINKQEALTKAISAYNSGNYYSGFSNGYVNKVLVNAQNTNVVE